MADYLTLAQAALLDGITDTDRVVYTEFVNKGTDWLWNNLPFHRAAAETGAAGFWYTFNREDTEPGTLVASRALNEDYTAARHDVTPITVKCGIFGQSFGFDRVLSSDVDSIAYQVTSAVKGVKIAYADYLINGDDNAMTGDPNLFDGLGVIVNGSSTEIDAAGDWSDWSAATDSGKALTALGELNTLLETCEGDENLAILTNRAGRAKISAMALMAGYRTASETASGRQAHTFNGVPVVALDNVIPTTDGATDIYVVSFGQNGVHGVSPVGADIVRTKLPNFDTAEAVAKGYVEMVATVAVKSTKSVARATAVQIAAAPQGGGN